MLTMRDRPPPRSIVPLPSPGGDRRQRLRRTGGRSAAWRPRLSRHGLEKLDAPGGRAYVVHRQDGFTFDAGPTIVTAPFLFEELWALCGRRMADDVEIRAITPFYQIRFHNGDVFNAQRDEAAMRAEVARFNPGDCRRLRSLHPPKSKRSTASASSGWATLRSIRFGDMARIAGRSRAARRPSQRLRPRVEIFPRRTPANRFQLSSAADRRESFPRQLDLLPDLVPRKAVGRPFRHGRDGSAGRRSRQSDREPGRRTALRRRSRVDRGRERPRDRGRARFGRDDPQRASSSPTPIRPGPIVISSPPARGSDGQTARSTERATRWGYSSGISASTDATRTSRTTRS